MDDRQSHASMTLPGKVVVYHAPHPPPQLTETQDHDDESAQDVIQLEEAPSTLLHRSKANQDLSLRNTASGPLEEEPDAGKPKGHKSDDDLAGTGTDSSPEDQVDCEYMI